MIPDQAKHLGMVQAQYREQPATAEERHRQEVETWAKLCEDLQEDLASARKRVADVESQDSRFRQGNLLLNLQIQDVAKPERDNPVDRQARTTWLRSVFAQIGDLQVRHYCYPVLQHMHPSMRNRYTKSITSLCCYSCFSRPKVPSLCRNKCCKYLFILMNCSAMNIPGCRYLLPSRKSAIPQGLRI
jgi:hypothetical protein